MIFDCFLLLNTDQYQHISFGGLYVKIRSALQKLWTKKWFCTVSLASISYSVTWKMCLLHTQNSFLRVPAKCFPQFWVGGSYLFLSFWWCTIKATSPSTVSNQPNSYSVTFWGSYEEIQLYRKWIKIEVLRMIFHNLKSILISRNLAACFNLISSPSYEDF